jgi:hypothetical protein
MKRIFYVAIFVLALSTASHATQASCEGALICSHGHYLINQGGESVCEFDEIGEIAVSAICSIGHYCRVTGVDAPCNEECARLIHINAVKSEGGIPAKLQHCAE